MTQFYWHIHHDVLLEPARVPIEERIAFIKQTKPAKEHELRLRLLKPVQGELPKSLVKAGAAYGKAGAAREKAGAAREKAWAAREKAWAAYEKAWAAYEKAWAAYEKAWAAYGKAWAAYVPEIEALHAQECPDCPWDGKTIFTEEKP